MDRKSLVQEYYILAVNENGMMSLMHKDESTAGVVVAGFMELLLNDIISVEKKKITVVKELPSELAHISSLYEYLSKKQRSTNKLMNDYMLSTSARRKELITQIGESLLEDGSAAEGKGGMFGNKVTYIPQEEYKNELISAMKEAVVGKDEMSPHDIALVYILKETKNLNQYFSEYENDKLKARLKEIKKNPQNKHLAEMINVCDMTAIMASGVLINS